MFWSLELSIARYFAPSSLKAPPKPSQFEVMVVPSLTVTVALAVDVASVPVTQ